MATVSCPNCGYNNESGDQYCVECGGALQQTAEEKPARKKSEGFPLVPVIIAVVALLIIGALAYAYLTGGISIPQKQVDSTPQQEFVGSDAPFLVLQTPGETGLDVLLSELNGDEIGRVGTTTGTDQASMLLIDGQYWLSFISASGYGQGVSAWAWPDDSVTLVALQTSAGWDLLRFNVANGEVKELVQAADWLEVQGYVQAANFWGRFQKKGMQSAWSADRRGEELVEVTGRDDILGLGMAPDGKHALFWNAEDGFVASADGRLVHQLDTFSTSQIGGFSPDGNTLFYSTGHQVVRAEADGRNGEIIAEVGRNDEMQPVAVGESYLAVQQNVGGRYDLRIMTWDGETTARYGRSDQPYYARYLPDNQGLLAFLPDEDGRKVETANVKGEERQTLISGVSPWPVIFKDDRHLAISFGQDGYRQLRLFDMKSWEYEDLERDLDDLRPLAVNERHLIYATRLGETWSLMAADARNGDTWELDAGAPNGYPAAFFTPKGDGVVYEARLQNAVLEIVDEESGYVQLLDYPEADIYTTALQNPDPKLLYSDANLLAASLSR